MGTVKESSVGQELLVNWVLESERFRVGTFFFLDQKTKKGKAIGQAWM